MALTSTQLAAYARLFDVRTQVVKASRQILDDGGISALGAGEGNQAVPRYLTTVDFSRGAFDPTSKSPLAQDLGAGPYRSSMYSRFTGILSIMNAVPFETEQKSGSAYLTEDHQRLLDQITAQELALFMEPLQPFTFALLPNLDVLRLIPIEPDERPVNEREVNVTFNRFLLHLAIRSEAWPDIA